MTPLPGGGCGFIVATGCDVPGGCVPGLGFRISGVPELGGADAGVPVGVVEAVGVPGGCVPGLGFRISGVPELVVPDAGVGVVEAVGVPGGLPGLVVPDA